MTSEDEGMPRLLASGLSQEQPKNKNNLGLV